MNLIDRVGNNILDWVSEKHDKFHKWTYGGEKTVTDNQLVALITVKFFLGIIVGFMIGVMYLTLT